MTMRHFANKYASRDAVWDAERGLGYRNTYAPASASAQIYAATYKATVMLSNIEQAFAILRADGWPDEVAYIGALTLFANWSRS